MATSPLQQVPAASVDLAGLSVTTGLRSSSDPRYGSVYDNTVMAAAAPIAFLPFGAGRYLMINARRWTAATPSGSTTGAYTAFTEDLLPNWVLVNAATGTRRVINSGPTIPMTTASDSRTLTAVEHRSPDFIYLLHDVVVGSDHSAVVQVWHTNTEIGTVNLIAEETLPVGTAGADTVLFNSGLYMSAPYMYLLGQGSSTNRVYMARKPWGQIGSFYNSSQVDDSPHPYWEYWTGTGYGTDPTALGAVQTTTGPMTTRGPISVARYGLSRTIAGAQTDYLLMSTVVASGSVRTAQVYSSLGNRPWSPVGSPVALGSAGTTYLGGTLQFQGVLGVNPTLVDTPDNATAIPYLTSIKTTSGGASKVTVAWDCWQVPRHT